MYRVDKRPFRQYEIIRPPENSYQEADGFNEDKQKLEKILSEERPDNKKNADRKTGLYIFTELSDAIRFCCRMSNSKIYKVKPHDDTICYHRGDMNWTEIMKGFLDNENTLRQTARLYWNGKMTFKPCIEVLVNEIEVTHVLVNDNQAMGLYTAYNKTSGNIERMDFYIETLKK